jgi:hypothetical protein
MLRASVTAQEMRARAINFVVGLKIAKEKERAGRTDW